MRVGTGAAAQQGNPGREGVPRGAVLPLCGLAGGHLRMLEFSFDEKRSLQPAAQPCGPGLQQKLTSSRELAIWAIIVVSVWRNAGYYMVMYLAGLQGVPTELYEAATMDGANGWQQFRKITMPMLTP
ncbi:MAG TPA: sugar ABC transporter permease, partial [Candidatus Limiplasma pullistercoris]|nr:sugar ABC transporter permease [Candidatus Limiplasma pullistercoris]